MDFPDPNGETFEIREGLYDDVHLLAYTGGSDVEKVLNWRNFFHGWSHKAEHSWGALEIRGLFFKKLMTEGTRLNLAIKKGEWSSITAEELIALTVLTMEWEPLCITLILEEAKYLLEFGATSYELMNEMEDKMRYHLSLTIQSMRSTTWRSMNGKSSLLPCSRCESVAMDVRDDQDMARLRQGGVR
jgi:hypothetical protein